MKELTLTNKLEIMNAFLEAQNFMSASDVAKKFGSSRQYWQKLFREGKIKYYQTSAGKITFEIYVQAFINKRALKLLKKSL